MEVELVTADIKKDEQKMTKEASIILFITCCTQIINAVDNIEARCNSSSNVYWTAHPKMKTTHFSSGL